MSERDENSLPVPATDTAVATAHDEAQPAAAPKLARKLALPPKATAISVGALLLIALVSIGVVLARKQLRKDAPAATAAEESAPAVTLDLPAATTPHAGESRPADKIFNQAAGSMKEGLDSFKHSEPSVDGTISELPPAPDGAANHALQDAAKDAAKLLAPDRTNKIDLSAPEPEAALESLERAAKADAATKDFLSPSVTASIHGAHVSNDFAGLKDALGSDRAATPGMSEGASGGSALEGFNDDFRQLKSEAEANAARRALAFGALDAKLRSGEPYAAELRALDALGGPALGADLAASAQNGLPTAKALADEFPAVRNEALAAARRERATGPVARFGAEIAGLIHLRPAKPVDGAGPVAVLSRAEAKIGEEDLKGALAELESLVGGAREACAGWMTKARARVGAEAALVDAGRAG